jgi:TolA-binding protein
LEYADTYFKPPKEDQKPDYEKALDFYGRALAVGPKLESRVRLELLIAQCQQKLDKFAEAAELYRKFLREHVDHALVVEARFRLGETLLANKQPAEAREAWQDLLDLHKGSASDLLPQAAFRMAETYQLPAPEDEEQLSLGVAALRRFLENFPQHALASKAQLWIGQSYQHSGHHEDAAAALTKFLADERYVKAEEIPDALNLLGGSYKMQGKFDQALATWKDFLAKHPTHPAWSAVQREIVNTEYAKAADRFQRKDYAAARQLWSEFLAKYPLDARSRATLFLLGQMSYAEEKWDGAISQWRQLVTKYPKSEEASRAQFMVARTLEDKLGKLDEALAEYRNVPSCSVRVYRIDLMKFSLLRRDLSDITSINLSGIRPSHQATVELGDGKDYRDRTAQLKLPLKDEGAYLVVCRAENQYASGMVLVTPLALEMQEQAESGRVRATVRNVVRQQYVPNAEVKVIGTRNDDFVSGETDLRGIFVADGIQGRSMVIAQAADGGYAFFRGQTELGPPPPLPPVGTKQEAAPAAQGAEAAAAAAPELSGKAQLLEGLQDRNNVIQAEKVQQLKGVYDNSVQEGIGGGFGGGFF